jgi:PAS domain S-box-containing protein
MQINVDDRTFSFDVAPIQDAGYANLYGHDVTGMKRVQAEETQAAVRTTAERTAVDTVNAMGEGVALCDTDGQIRNVNPAFASLTDYEGTDLVGRNIMGLLPDVFDELEHEVQETITRIQLKSSARDPADALSITTSRGVRKWVIPTLTTIHGPQREAVGIVLTLRDISALIKAQTELKESARQYRELVENANSIIMRITPDRRVTFFNEYAQGFFGYSTEEMLGKSIVGTLLPRTDSEGHDLQKMTEELAAHPEMHGAEDTEALCKDGRRVWVHWSNRAIRDEQGRVKEVLCVGTDITERKRLAREAEAYRRRLRALADRLTATEEQERRRVATQIHDTVIQTLSLSNIRLGGVLAAVEKAGMSDQRKRVEGVRQLLDQGTQECRGLMEELVPSLLYEVGLHAALREFAQKQSRSDGTHITVEGEDNVGPMDDAQRGLLFQCARELIMNALKHAGQSEIRVFVSSTDEHIQLQVQDTGRGFDPAELDGKKHDEQGGFGLFNIRERVEGLGGRLEIESALGKGTTARVIIPVGTGQQSAVIGQ